jgi:fluoroquinolone resistance protein
MNDRTRPAELGAATLFSKREFKRLRFEGCVEGVAFEGCRFVECSFQEARLVDCSFVESQFAECDLTIARVDGTRFAQVEMLRCRLSGVNWSLAAWPNIRLDREIAFHACKLDFCVFMDVSLPGADFLGCSLKEVDFSDAMLAGANFAASDLTGARFNNTDLRGAHLEGAHGYLINPMSNKLGGAHFRLPEAAALLAGLGIVLEE